MACGSWNVVTAAGLAPEVIRDRMNVIALTEAGELSVAWVKLLLVTEPPASARYSMKSQVRPSQESPSQTNPYFTAPEWTSCTESLSSCCQVVGTDMCALDS